MYNKTDFYKILDFHFADKKFNTANRVFFESLENLRKDSDKFFESPWTVSWQLTSGCNLRCKHCFFEGNEKFYDTKNNLDTTSLLNLADELIDLNIVAVSLSGGEALLRDDLFVLLRKLKKKNIAVSLQTNGTMITQDIANELSKILNKYTDYVQVSLDGANKEIYERIRGMGTFDKAINGITLLINAGINVNVNSTILSLNKNNVPSIYELVNNLGVKKLSLSNFLPSSPGHEFLKIDFVSLIEPLAKTIELSENGKTFLEINYKFYNFVSDENIRTLLDEYLFENNIRKSINENISCHKHNTLYINANGEVYLCYNCSMKDGLMGKYPEKTLQEIWDNRNNIVFFQKKLAKFSECKSCKYFKYCLGGCMGNAYQKYHSIYAKDYLCNYTAQSK